MNRPTSTTEHFELPNLCAPQAVLLLILAAVLLAMVLVLFQSGLAGFDWIMLGRTATFILWTMLGSAALLCALRQRIAALPLAVGAALAWGLVIATCALTSVVWQWALSGLIDGRTGRIDALILARDVLVGALIAGVVLRYFYLQAEIIAGHRAELTARLEALQARIRPHFLFNSMNIIASLIAIDPEAAERAVEDLSALFRASLREHAGTHPLADELELCERYMRLEQLRIGDRMRYTVVLESVPDNARLPPLSLQPLLENAVYHGVQPLVRGGEIRLRIYRQQQMLVVDVRNPVASDSTDTGGSGMALRNIRERLRMLYPDTAAALETGMREGEYVARLTVPLESA